MSSIASTESDYRTVGPMRVTAWFVFALMAAVLVGGFVQYQEDGYFAALDEAGVKAKTELLLAATLEDVITEDRARLETTVELYQESNPNFYSFAVADEDGNNLLSWKRTGISKPQKFLMFLARSYPLQRSAVPVAFDGEIYGNMIVEWDQSAQRAQRDTHTYVMGAAAAMLCLVFAPIGYNTGRRHG